MKHELKTWPAYFAAVDRGEKRFEIRDNRDRGFQKGDCVILKEYDHGKGLGRYSGEEIMVEITYVTNFQQQEGFVVFGFVRIDD